MLSSSFLAWSHKNHDQWRQVLFCNGASVLPFLELEAKFWLIFSELSRVEFFLQHEEPSIKKKACFWELLGFAFAYDGKESKFEQN